VATFNHRLLRQWRDESGIKPEEVAYRADVSFSHLLPGARADRMGVRLAEIVWCPPGEPPIKVCEMVPERLPLLAEYLAGGLAHAG
jgi:hypothetical protein